MHLDAIQVLLEHNPDVNSRDSDGRTPLHDITSYSSGHPERMASAVQQLLEHGADPNACDDTHSTPLHQASSRGWGFLEVALVLPSYGANVHEKDGQGWTPFRVASENGHHEVTKLLLERGAVAQP